MNEPSRNGFRIGQPVVIPPFNDVGIIKKFSENATDVKDRINLNSCQVEPTAYVSARVELKDKTEGWISVLACRPLN